MCGFLITRKKGGFTDAEILRSAHFIAQRGPSATASWRSSTPDSGGYVLQMQHFLLDISGSGVAQPQVLASGDVFLFNGELYEIDGVSCRGRSDTLLLKAVLERYGLDGIRRVRGEYVLLVFSPDKNCLTILTDDFMTKPVFLGRGPDPSEFALASYPSALTALGYSDVFPLQPNSHLEICFRNRSVSTTEFFPVRDWELDLEHDDYHSWELAFRKSVRDRALHGCFEPTVFLSSGYDSGAIALALNLEGIPYRTLTLTSGENAEIIEQRIERNAAFCPKPLLYDGLTKAETSDLESEMRLVVEPYRYAHTDSGERAWIWEDSGAKAGFYLARIAAQKNYRVVLSGCGADELYSDYGHEGKKLYGHSEFGGLFPSELEGFFPWKKFYGDTMRSYLFKDELVLGACGIEGRYPFLDRKTVQTFLNFSAADKNSSYKAPIFAFLSKYDYPIEWQTKRGFSSRKHSRYTMLRDKLFGRKGGARIS